MLWKMSLFTEYISMAFSSDMSMPFCLLTSIFTVSNPRAPSVA